MNALCALLLSFMALQLNAQVIPFSMAEEEASKNTPDGWTAVSLPTGLPEFTAANTFYINAAPYNASTESADNTEAIQAALDAAASAGGGMVVVPAGTWLTGCLTMGSKTVLHLCEGATLMMLPHSAFPTDGNGFAKMDNPFITGKSGASDIVIEGESRSTSIIDGQGAPWWDDVETAKAASKSTTRQAMIRFWQGNRYLFRNFRIQNTPNTNITIGKSGKGGHATVHDITILNPASDAADPSHNTDGIPIWSQYVNIYDCEIDTGDDNVVCDQEAQYVHVWNCNFLHGHGASFGSFTTNMHHIIYEDLTLNGTEAGFRLKSNRDRSGDVHDIIFRNCTMTNVASPFSITAWYDTLPNPETVAANPDPLIDTTPEFHDILIQNVTVSGHTTYNGYGKNYFGIFIYGRPESKVHDVVFDNVKITHSKGLKLNFCEGITFYDNCSFTVYNTNNTSVNGTATAAANGLDALIEQKYEGSYTWNVEKPGSQDFNVSWSMADGESSTATASIDDVVVEQSWAKSSKIAFNSTATYGGNTLTKFNPTEDHNPRVERNANYYVEWTFRVFPGYTFKPESVSFDALKCGTGDPTIDVDFTDGTDVTQQLATNAAITRDSKIGQDGEPDINHSYTITTANNASGNAVKLRIYIGKCKTDKQVAFGRIVINGKLSGEKSALDNYTVTYENDDVAAYGKAPAAVNVVQYESTTIPANTTLYKTGYTLTGWNDGTSTYAIGDDYTPTTSVTMHPVFTANTKTLSDFPTDRTVTWYFGKSNGAPDYDGTANAQVKQISIGGSKIDLGVKMAGGSNEGRGDEWMNNQSKNMTVSVVKNAVVKAKVYYTNDASFNGENIPYNESYGTQGNVVYTYTYTGEEPADIAVNVGNQFLSYISVTYPGTGDPWDNFQDFSAIINNQSGTLLTEAEMAKQGNDVNFGVAVDAGVVSRVAADDDDRVATISGKYHGDHGCTNVNVVVPVPGPVKISVGECTYSSSNITITNSASQVITKTPEKTCWKNDHSKVAVVYYTGEPSTLTITGMSYCPYIAVESAPLYTITGTIAGGNIDGKKVILTSNLTGQTFEATVASNAFTLNVPADTYDITLSDNDDYVISNPTSVVVSAAAPLTINVVSSTPQTVTGQIANAPAEAFTLTFTGANYVETVNCEANATSFTKALKPDTYVMSSNVGTLSTLSKEGFQVLNAAVNHNIYFPEAASPNATQAAITVDNTILTETANNYKSVTNALAAAKAGGVSNPVITLTSGQTYMEQVIVDMPNVTLKTSDTGKATITWYYGIGYSYYSLNASGYYDKDHAMTRNSMNIVNPGRWGTTVLVKNTGAGFKAESIIFENSFNQRYTPEEVIDGVRATQVGDATITYDRTLTPGDTGYKAADSKAATERAAAIAFENNPTGVELYNCEFVGSQDTFYSSGEIYVKNCNIIGNTDYIFGGGYVVFDDCDLTIGGYSDSQNTAYITAYKDGANLDENKKYVFRDCTVKSYGRTYTAANLGRDWGGSAASVYFFNLKNEIGNKLSYTWNSMNKEGGVKDGTADLHIYDFDATINANYATTGTSGANINGVLNEATALSVYGDVTGKLGFTPAHIYDGNLVLGESSAYNKCRIATNDGVERTVELTRSIKADKWSTIVLPFALTEGQITAAFGSGVKVAELASSTETGLTFNTVTAMAANQPYAIKVSSDFADATINDVTIAKAEPQQTVSNWTFNGTYTSTTAPVDSYVFSGNQLRKVTADNVTVKPFRAYLTYSGATPANELEFILDGDATGIAEVRGQMEDGRCDYYDLQGRKVAQPTKGLYIVNGRKVIVK